MLYLIKSAKNVSSFYSVHAQLEKIEYSRGKNLYFLSIIFGRKNKADE